MINQRLPSIYDYSDYRSYLKATVDVRKSENPRFSLGVWAQRLGLSSSSTLIMILKGQRNPGHELIEAFAGDLKLRQREAAFFKDLVNLEKCKDDAKLQQTVLDRLRFSHPDKTFQVIEGQKFEAVSRWYYYAIRELVDLPDFREDSTWIAERLRYRVPRRDIEEALQTMVNLGLLVRDASGKLIYTQPVFSTNDIPQEGLKRFHEQMLDLIKDSVRTLPESDREISGMTFTFNEEDLPRAKEAIRAVYRELLQLSSNKKDSQVYHVEVALMPLTKREKK